MSSELKSKREVGSTGQNRTLSSGPIARCKAKLSLPLFWGKQLQFRPLGFPQMEQIEFRIKIAKQQKYKPPYRREAINNTLIAP